MTVRSRLAISRRQRLCLAAPPCRPTALYLLVQVNHKRVVWVAESILSNNSLRDGRLSVSTSRPRPPYGLAGHRDTRPYDGSTEREVSDV